MIGERGRGWVRKWGEGERMGEKMGRGQFERMGKERMLAGD